MTTPASVLSVRVWVGVGAIVSAAHEYNKYMRIAAIRGKMGKKGVKWTSRDWRKGRKASKGRVIKLGDA